MILIARKLTTKRLIRFIDRNQNSFILEIPHKKLTEFENELKGVNRDELQQYDQVNDCLGVLLINILKAKKIQEKISDTLDEC